MPILPASEQNIKSAAARLLAGELVAFPTETVYGLGALALNCEAVSQIYRLKGRPAHNPLIVHVGDVAGARQLVAEWPREAEQLARTFWPGPLTLVLPRNAVAPDCVTAGGDTVAVRVPANPVALELLREAGAPLAAPSANRTNQLSPTLAHHVSRSLGEDLWVLDGGPCQVGIESTVVSLAGARPRLLRPGNISTSQLEAVIGPLQEWREADLAEEGADAPHPSPGLSRRHYAPRAPVLLFSTTIDAHFQAVLLGQGRKLGVIAFASTSLQGVEKILPEEPTLYARGLFQALHELDEAGCELILVEAVPEVSAWDGVRDRLKRAAAS